MALEEIRRQIDSINKTSQITKAMSLVSTTKYNRIVNISSNYEIYATKIRQTVANLMRQVGDISNAGYVTNSDLTSIVDFHDLLINRPVKKSGYLVITSDKGLVGGYNSTILESMMDTIGEYHPEGNDFEIIAIGGMGADFFKARGIDVAFELRGLEDQPSFEEVARIISKSVEMYKNELFDELYVCYNHHVNSLTSQVRMQQMLPITELDVNQASEGGASFELEPNREAILEQLLPQYTESLIYGAIVDAKTAEHAAGMSAMQTATDNAKNVINDLTIQYNRARQAEITQEITEIVAGASALE